MSAELRRFLASDTFLDAAKKKVEAAVQEANDRGLPQAYNGCKQECKIFYNIVSVPRFSNKPK